MSSPITTHVLDTGSGQPAAGVAVTLEIWDDEEQWVFLGSGVTDSDGRLDTLLTDVEQVEAASYRLRFDAGSYFAASGTATMYGIIPIDIVVTERRVHLHIPLLLSPYHYSTYRGS